MKKWTGLLFVLFFVVAISSYVGGFFIVTEFVPDRHPMLDAQHRRIFPSQAWISFWRPMLLYDRRANPGIMWCDRNGRIF